MLLVIGSTLFCRPENAAYDGVVKIGMVPDAMRGTTQKGNPPAS
jgi:hypothetical protein